MPDTTDADTIFNFGDNKMEITVENLNCPLCDLAHHDIDKWALDPHKTHLCLHCGELFKGTLRGVSRPTFVKMDKPTDVVYKYKNYRNILDADSETTAKAIIAYVKKHTVLREKYYIK